MSDPKKLTAENIASEALLLEDVWKAKYNEDNVLGLTKNIKAYALQEAKEAIAEKIKQTAQYYTPLINKETNKDQKAILELKYEARITAFQGLLNLLKSKQEEK